eukprot:TRINITY_DN8798_c0_g1_i1.p1 TRINITY_DN8798_c0_g1~~TRINITY_DN8798_c0_g1_i1.p1  ORF type:complete len:380 (-),score=76.31 TRINITY_DN8798_c0_g1_i1:61-1200(-)
MAQVGEGFKILEPKDKNSTVCVICLEDANPECDGVDIVEFEMMMAPAAATLTSECSPREFLLHEEQKIHERRPGEYAAIVELTDCKHRFCTACIHYWIIAQMQRGKFSSADLKCLTEKCPNELPLQLIEHCLNDQELIELRRLKKLTDVYRNPDLMFCGNQEHCDNVLVKRFCDKEMFLWGKLHCGKCGFDTCVDCGQEFHHRDVKFPLQKYFCKSNQCGTKQLDDKFQQWKNKRPVKRCPACRRFIHKLKGCNHVTCACGYEFCWICGGKYGKKHFARWNVFGCPGLMFQETYGMPCNHLLLVQVLFRLVFSVILTALALLILGFYVGVMFPVCLVMFVLSWVCCLPAYNLRAYGFILKVIERVMTFKDLRRYIYQLD